MRKATFFNFRKATIRIIGLMMFISFCAEDIYAQNDCPPLSVFCQDLHTTFMPDACMVEVWAKDFINKINDGDTDLDDFIISFDEDTEEPSRIFVSVEGDTYEVTIYITSKCDTTLTTRCVVMLDINDNTGDCPKQCPIDPNPWCGYAVVTCTTVQQSPREFTGHVAAIVDTRKNSQAPRGDNWSLPVQQNFDPVPFIRPEAWRISQLGNIFGIALNPTNGDIFLSASDVYDFDFQNFITVGPPPPSVSGPAGPGGIYKSNFADPENTTVLVSTTSVYPNPANFNATIIGTNIMPNTGNIADNQERSGNGIGNIDYDIRSDNLFASNLEDGKLYSINSSTGIIVDVHDPFEAYAHSVGMVKQSERIWGVAVDDCDLMSRLYFARATRTPSNTTDVLDPKEVWSIALNPDGTFAGEERIEFIVERGDQSKITDLGFSVQCHEILLAERGNAHSAEIHRYRQQPDDSWLYNRQFFVGINAPNNTNATLYPNGIRGNSAGGGVSYGSTEEGCVIDFDCNGIVWATTNCGDIAADDNNDPPTLFDCAIYGAQGMHRSGNHPVLGKQNDIFFSFDTVVIENSIQFKSNIGDIEVFNCCCPVEEGRNTPNIAVSAMIAGEVYTEQKNRVKDTRVSVTSNVMQDESMTNATGEYLFEELSMHNNYTISPNKTDDILDGLSTLDLVLIQRHILGLTKLKSPYKIIAADIDNNGKVSALDMVKIRKILLGTEDGNNYKSWSFVPSNFQFSDELNPFPFEETIGISDLEKNAMHEDFIAIKMGDVNGDNGYNLKSNIRNSNRITLNIEWSGNTAYFSLGKDIDILGLQFEIALGSNELISSLTPGILPITHSNYFEKDGFIKFSWNNSNELKLQKGDVLFSLDLSTENVSNLQLIEHSMKALVYNDELESIAIELSSTLLNNKTTLLGNAPNPFSEETIISFIINKSQEVTFDFYSVDGQLIYSSKNRFDKGRNTFSVNTEELNSGTNNIIFYRMNTENETYFGKMIQFSK